MKQFTTEQQTAKLIELGFEKPPKKGLLFQSTIGNCLTDLMLAEENYSIGELLSFLPENIAKEDEMPSTLNISLLNDEWYVEYADFLGADFSFRSVELIDALYDMCVKLKERGTI